MELSSQSPASFDGSGQGSFRDFVMSEVEVMPFFEMVNPHAEAHRGEHAGRAGPVNLAGSHRRRTRDARHGHCRPTLPRVRYLTGRLPKTRERLWCAGYFDWLRTAQPSNAAPSNRSRVMNSVTDWRRSLVSCRVGLPRGTTATSACASGIPSSWRTCSSCAIAIVVKVPP